LKIKPFPKRYNGLKWLPAGSLAWRKQFMSDIEPGPEETRAPEPQSGDTGPPQSQTGSNTDSAKERETNMWAMFIHFSLLAGWVVPLAGLLVPIILWQVKKDELPGIVPHAHIVMNWILTSLVYSAICFILMFVVIGVFGFIALAMLTIAYALIGGIKANDGEIWEYPGTIIKVFK
jgi:uncharacterized Tic20 family protein